MLLPKVAGRGVTQELIPYPRGSTSWLDLRFEGTEGSTSLVNSGEAALTSINITGQSITTSDAKSGLSCWNGGSTTQNTNFTVPNFTNPSFGLCKIDFWVKLLENGTGGARTIMTIPFVSSGGAKTIHVYMEYYNSKCTVSVNFAGDGATWYAVSPWDISTWYNITFDRFSDRWVGLVNGVPLRVWSAVASLPNASDSGSTKIIYFGPGENWSSRPFLLDSFRVIKK